MKFSRRSPCDITRFGRLVSGDPNVDESVVVLFDGNNIPDFGVASRDLEVLPPEAAR